MTPHPAGHAELLRRGEDRRRACPSADRCDSAAPISDGSAIPWPRRMTAVAGRDPSPLGARRNVGDGRGPNTSRPSAPSAHSTTARAWPASRGPSIDIVVKARPSGPASLARRLAQASSKRARQHEHEAAEEEHQGELHRHAAAEGPAAEQRQVEQWLAAPPGQAAPPRQREREDRTQAAQVQAGQPLCRGPRSAGSRADATDAETPAAPSGSSRGLRRPRACGTTSAAATSAAAPTGTFTRKIARQPRPSTSACSSSPPSNGRTRRPAPS